MRHPGAREDQAKRVDVLGLEFEFIAGVAQVTAQSARPQRQRGARRWRLLRDRGEAAAEVVERVARGGLDLARLARQRRPGAGLIQQPYRRSRLAFSPIRDPLDGNLDL